jgi:hypothetical protein
MVHHTFIKIIDFLGNNQLFYFYLKLCFEIGLCLRPQ